MDIDPPEHHLSQVETTDDNMMLVGIPPRAGGASTGELRVRRSLDFKIMGEV